MVNTDGSREQDRKHRLAIVVGRCRGSRHRWGCRHSTPSRVAAASLIVNTRPTVSTPTSATASAAPAPARARCAPPIQEANALAGADTIALPAGTYAITIPPINDNLADNGDFDVTGPLTITGAGAATTIIDAGTPPGGLAPEVRGLDRLLDIHPTAKDVTVSGVTLREGYNTEAGGAIRYGPDETVEIIEGVPVITTGTLRLVDVHVIDSYSAKHGGGIHNVAKGRIEITGSTLTGNGSSEGGAAINNAGDGTIVIEGSVVSENPGPVVPDPTDPGGILLADPLATTRSPTARSTTRPRTTSRARSSCATRRSPPTPPTPRARRSTTTGRDR